MAQALISGEMYCLTHNYKLPKQFGGQKASTFLGVFLIDNSSMRRMGFRGGELNLGKLEKIPKGKSYVFTLLPDAEDALEASFYGKIPSRLIPKPKIGDALEYGDWLRFMESKELTIADIEALEPKEKLVVVQLHRNLGDMVLDRHVNAEGVSIPASEFFLLVQGTYIHEQGLHGGFYDIWAVRKAVDAGLDYVDADEFNFDLNYEGKRWYPLNDDGLLPVETGEPCIKNAVADYRKYPKTTKVGMRGPMLRWSDVEKAPPIYWRQEKFSFKFV
jgi:hypothetical protein